MPRLSPLLLAVLLAGCATRSGDVLPLPADPKDYAAWSCDRIHDEVDLVHHRAADLAYAVDERAGNNLVALGLGLAVWWPAILALRPEGIEARELAQLKGRHEALQQAATDKHCPPPGRDLPADRAATWPVAVGERLVYEERPGLRGSPHERVLRVTALRRDEVELEGAADGDGAPARWRQDLAGNLPEAPDGALQWRRLLRRDLQLGQVVGGEIVVGGETLARARVRGQVVAVGPQLVAGRRFDAAVVELFGDVQRGEASTRLEGAIVIDRTSGVLLRLDLRSAVPAFSIQRRLLRVEPAA